jgi:hypothetical protein
MGAPTGIFLFRADFFGPPPAPSGAQGLGMRASSWAVLAGFLGVWAGPGVAEAQQMRCQGRLVGVGDTAHQLRAVCGAPDHVASRVETRAEGVVSPPVAAVAPGAAGQPVVVAPGALVQDVVYVEEPVEVWTYVGEPGALARLVTVRRGLVAAIQTTRVAPDADPGCERGAPRSGATVGEVRLRCGAPADVSRWTEERVRRRADGYELRLRVERSRWVYDLGPGRFLRILTFEDGKLLKVETGPRSPG